MNQKHVDYPIEEHDVRVACLDPVALAYEWITQYAKNLTDQVNDAHDARGGPVTVDDLLDIADSHQPENDSTGWGGDYLVRGGTFEGESIDPTFWAKYAILRGKQLEDVEQAHFFSCSC